MIHNLYETVSNELFTSRNYYDFEIKPNRSIQHKDVH